MANKIHIIGIGNMAFQNVSDSTINYSQQIVGKSPEYADLLDQLETQEDLLKFLPETEEEKRLKTTQKIFTLKKIIENFKADVLRLAESFSRIEINTDRLQRAKRHFDKGEITEARIVLEDTIEEMEDEKRWLLAKKDEFEIDLIPKLKAKAVEYLILAQTTALNYENPNRFDDADRFYLDSVKCFGFYENFFAYAIFLLNRGEMEDTIFLLELALEIARDDNQKHNETSCLENLGIAYHYQGDFLKAIEFYIQAFKMARITRDRSSAISSLGNMGSAYFALGDCRKAIRHHLSAVKLARRNGDREQLGIQMGNLGRDHFTWGDIQGGIRSFEQALEIALEIGDRESEGINLSNLGESYRILEEYQKAINYYEQALSISREIGHRLREATLLEEMGSVYNSLGETKAACDCWRQASEIFLKIVSVSKSASFYDRMLEAGCFDGNTEDSV